MRHLLEAARDIELRRAALSLQHDVIEQSDGGISVEFARLPNQPKWNMAGDGVAMSFVSDFTRAKTVAVVCFDHTEALVIKALWSANLMSIQEMMSGSHYVKLSEHKAVSYILKCCFAVPVGSINYDDLNKVRNRKLLIDDGHKRHLLKHLVINKRLVLGEYGAFVDSNLATKMGKSHTPIKLYRYRIDAISTSIGAEYPSVEAMLEKYRAAHVYELWAGIELKVYSYEHKRAETLRWGVYAFFSTDGFPIRFFTLEEAV